MITKSSGAAGSMILAAPYFCFLAPALLQMSETRINIDEEAMPGLPGELLSRCPDSDRKPEDSPIGYRSKQVDICLPAHLGTSFQPGADFQNIARPATA